MKPEAPRCPQDRRPGWIKGVHFGVGAHDAGSLKAPQRPLERRLESQMRCASSGELFENRLSKEAGFRRPVGLRHDDDPRTDKGLTQQPSTGIARSPHRPSGSPRTPVTPCAPPQLPAVTAAARPPSNVERAIPGPESSHARFHGSTEFNAQSRNLAASGVSLHERYCDRRSRNADI